MKLPLHLLHRLRRKLRRSMRRLNHPASLRAIDEWTGYRPPGTPRDPMKTLRQIAILLLLAVAVLYAVSCATVETRTVTTDKAGTVTETVTRTRSADPAALRLAGDVAAAYAPPRARLVRQEKSGPITPDEIAARWKPAP